jgi:hypothetical protein
MSWLVERARGAREMMRVMRVGVFIAFNIVGYRYLGGAEQV